MFLFLKLYLAHLIADFILQFEELYQLKVRSPWGHFFHVAIHASISLLIVAPYLGDPVVWIFVIALCTVHYFQDRIKYSLTARYPEHRFALFAIDQSIHILFICSVFLLPASRKVLGFPGAPGLDSIYTRDFWTLCLIAFIWTTFGAAYTLNSIRKNFIPGSRPDHLISSFELSHGIVERTLITGMFLFSSSPLALMLTPAVGFLRLPFPKLKNLTDFILSFVFAFLIGLLFRRWL